MLSIDKAAIRHTRFYTVRKDLPTLNTVNSALVGYLSFSGSVGTLRKRLGCKFTIGNRLVTTGKLL